MTNKRPSKEEILLAIDLRLRAQLRSLEAEIESMNEELGNETKSSAGDKFETSREMMNQELDRLEQAVTKINQHQRTLSQIQAAKPFSQVEMGSLVHTAQMSFLIGMGLGKVELDNFTVMAVSLNSPIGKAFYQKKSGNSIDFMNQKYSIQSID